MTAAFILAKTGRDALYLQAGGVHDLPQAYMAIAVLSVPTAFLMLGLMRRLGARRTRVWSGIVISVALGVLHKAVRPGGGVLMTGVFAFVPLAFSVLFAVTWLLAADLLEGAPRAAMGRAYAWISAASILGGVAGGALAWGLAPFVEPRLFLLLAVGVLAASVAATAVTQRRFPRRSVATEAAVDVTSTSMPSMFRQPYPALLLAVGMAGSLVGVLVEFQLYVAAAASGADARASASFFAGVYLVLNGAALVLQVWAMPWLQRAVGIDGSLHVLPGALLSGALALVATASLLARSLLRVAEGGLKASIHRVNWEQAYLPLRHADRAAAKVLVDGAGARIAEGIAALMLFIWLRFVVGGGSLAGHSTAWLNYALLAAAVLWLLLTRALARRLGSVGEGAAGELRLDVPLPDG
jgi:hypothetical protein